jgi:hypothetical protein
MPLPQELLAAGAQRALNKPLSQPRPGRGCAVSTSRHGASACSKLPPCSISLRRNDGALLQHLLPAVRACQGLLDAGTASGCGRPASCRRTCSQRHPSCRLPLVLLPELGDEAHQSLSPDVHLQCILLHVHPLDQKLDDPRLLRREQLVPHYGEVGEQDRGLALGDLVLALPLRRRFLLQRLNRGRLIVPGPGRRSGMSPLLTAFGTTWK